MSSVSVDEISAAIKAALIPADLAELSKQFNVKVGHVDPATGNLVAQGWSLPISISVYPDFHYFNAAKDRAHRSEEYRLALLALMKTIPPFPADLERILKLLQLTPTSASGVEIAITEEREHDSGI